MLDFTLEMKLNLVFGKTAIDHLSENIKKFNGHKVMVVSYGIDFLSMLGIKDVIESQFKENEIEYCYFNEVVPNPRVEMVRHGIEIARQENVDFLIAVGGGSAIDTAKSIALGKNYDGDIWEFTEKKIAYDGCLPIGVILTIAASGSEVSAGAILNNDELGLKRGLNGDMLPKFCIMNPEYTYGVNPYATACGCVDMLSHVIERYFTSTKDTELIDRMAEGVMVTIINNTRKVMKNPKDYDARSQLMFAGSMAHNGLLGTARERDWSPHYIEHEVSALYDVTHGAGLAILTPNWMKYVYKQDVEQFAKFGNRVFGIAECEDKEKMALEAISKLEEFYAELNMPKSLEEVGVSNENFELIAENALVSRPGLGSIIKMNKEHIINILNMSLKSDK